MSHDKFDPDYVFSHHHASPKQLADFQAVHDSAKQLARVILEHVPESDDQFAALQLLREVSMLACSAISLEGRLKK